MLKISVSNEGAAATDSVLKLYKISSTVSTDSQVVTIYDLTTFKSPPYFLVEINGILAYFCKIQFTI